MRGLAYLGQLVRLSSAEGTNLENDQHGAGTLDYFYLFCQVINIVKDESAGIVCSAGEGGKIEFILVTILIVGLPFGILIGPSLNHFLSSLPDYQERLSFHIAALISWLREKGVNIPQEEVVGTFNPGWVMGLAGGKFSALSSLLTNALLILFTVVFILLEAADLPNKLRLVLKNPERSPSTIEKFSQDAKRYLVIKTGSEIALAWCAGPFGAARTPGKGFQFTAGPSYILHTDSDLKRFSVQAGIDYQSREPVFKPAVRMFASVLGHAWEETGWSPDLNIKAGVNIRSPYAEK